MLWRKGLSKRGSGLKGKAMAPRLTGGSTPECSDARHLQRVTESQKLMAKVRASAQKAGPIDKKALEVQGA